MPGQIRSVAILAAILAFSGILSRTLEDSGAFRVAVFSSSAALTTFLRIAPIDVVLLDTDLPYTQAIDIAVGLRAHQRLAINHFDIVALSRAAKPFHGPLLAAGIDEVIEKPVSPSELLGRLELRFARQRGPFAPAYQPAERQHTRRDLQPRTVERVGNVIPLFGEGRAKR